MTESTTIATAPGALPILGHVPLLLRDPLAFVRTLPDHGSLVQIRLGLWKVIVVCDPALTRRLLVDDRTFDKGGPMFDRLKELTGNGVGACPHAEHRRQRRAVQPAFHSSRMATYAQTMTTQSTLATQMWRDGQEIDVLNDMSALTARVGVSTLFTDVLTPTELTNTVDDVQTVMTGLFRRIFTPPPLDRIPTPGKRRYDRARGRLRRTVGRIITDYRAADVDHGDLLSMLIAPVTDTPGLSDAEIEDQAVTFLLASIETSANALAWTLHLLAHHPAIEKRLHDEVDEVLEGRPATFEDLPNLPLTNRVVTESLRLYPPGWFFTRTTTTQTEFGGQRIPAGSVMAYSPYLIHHRSDLYGNASAFDPDRWTGDNPALAPNAAFLPFGGGARKCIGDAYALTEACIALASICARWTLQTTTSQPVKLALNAQLRPRNLRMRTMQRPAAAARAMPPTSRG